MGYRFADKAAIEPLGEPYLGLCRIRQLLLEGRIEATRRARGDPAE